MKYWRNKDNTKALKLASVDYWEFTCAEEVTTEEAILEMNVNGASITLQGDDAEEVYKILHSQKEVL
jgi:hypothetical protein